MTILRRLTIWIAAMTVGLVAMAVMIAGAAHAQGAAAAPAPDAVGDWHGVLSAPGVELRVGVTLTRDAAGGLGGKLFSPDQTPEPFPLTKVQAGGGKLSFSVPSVLGSYDGAWDPARQAWVGSWTQGQGLPLTLTKGPAPDRK